ncbi:Glycogen synthase [Planctomycetes bacterium Pla163]|uniref:Glycogen synthase n=1 Tax=Rohdeia mirabilis TaxID=2528008 RepID=A0A518CZA4_9BACT|nr:Glycogen synthase [Planctomycetes bacterium Pla163]
MPHVLHVLCQRPGLTGSGVTLERLTGATRALGFEASAVIGVPVDGETRVRGVDDDAVTCVRFASNAGGALDLPHDVVGMSDVMPYRSRTWASLDAGELDAWWNAFVAAIRGAAERRRPDLVHAHHAWLVAAAARDALPGVPLVVHGHGSDLRQFDLAPKVGQKVRAHLAGLDRLVTLHTEQAERYAERLAIDAARTCVVGSGFEPERFDPTGRERLREQRIVFVGKLSHAKGVDALLLAHAILRRTRPRARLVLVGGGSGPQSDALRAQARAQPGVDLAGRLDDDTLVRVLHSSAVMALPSLWEGLPLVLLEGAAAGAQLAATGLPGVVGALAGPLGNALEVVAPPRTVDGESCAPGELEPFAERLAAALDRALAKAQRGERAGPRALAPFTWDAVAGRVADVWREVLASAGTGGAARS